ncbi:FGFR1 oncoprotein partner [Tritrichomonas musculus]|uniref:FGFR1 oncoprotein partner n=1 Tax=Tritrichomonas musculus TaxID=1915356 RepID=A0ABR2K0I8_9EUKA
MSSDLDQLETGLMDAIAQSLETNGYLPRIRAQLKVNALAKAQDLEKNGTISNSDQIHKKEIENDDDAVMVKLCRQLFEFCKLDETVKMMDIEIAQKDNVNIADKCPQIDASAPEPGILQLVDKASSKQ